MAEPSIEKKKKLGMMVRGERATTLTAPVPQTHARSDSTAIPYADIGKMGEESFDVEGYVRTMLQKLPNEDAVQQLQRTLADSKDNISQELQKNVYRNYNEFVVISKEISKLEGDMIAVRRVLNEVKEVRDRFSTYSLDGDFLN